MSRRFKQHATIHWEAGESGCGQLMIGLKREVSALKDGQRLELVALDAGARIDIPAWCRITGHSLVSENHPTYVIRRKGDRNV